MHFRQMAEAPHVLPDLCESNMYARYQKKQGLWSVMTLFNMLQLYFTGSYRLLMFVTSVTLS